MSLWFFLWVLAKSFLLMIFSLWPYALGALVLMAIPKVSDSVRQFLRGGG